MRPLAWKSSLFDQLHSYHSPAEVPRCLGLTAVPYWIWDRRNNLFGMDVYIVSNETKQCDVLPCLAETDGCDFNCSPQLAPGHLVRLDGSPALTGLDMVDTIPAYDGGPNPSSCSVFSCLQTTPMTGYKDLEPEDISGTVSSSLPRVPFEAPTPVTESSMTPALRSIPWTQPPELLCRLEN